MENVGLEAQTRITRDDSSGILALRWYRAARWPGVASGFVPLVSLAVALMFVRSSVAHLSNPYHFLSSIYAYQLVGEEVGYSLALALPFIQIAIVACLFARVFVPGALTLATLLFASYAIVQVSAVWRGLNVSCGCFGAMESSPVNGGTIAMVVVLGVSCALACMLTLESTATPRVTGGFLIKKLMQPANKPSGN